MSEHITHTALCDDVQRLCGHLPDLPADFVRAWYAHRDAAHMGGVTRQADSWSVDVIAYARDEFRKPPAVRDPTVDRKLAFVLGALTHRSIDRHVKPMFAYFKQAVDARVVNGTPVNLCTIYCDMLILKEVFAIDGHFSPELFDPKLAGSRKAFQELLRSTFQRTLIQMHTFKPDSANVHDWMERLFSGMQDFQLRLDLYDDVAAHPDPALRKRFLDDTNFYDPADPLIATVRLVQRGGTPDASCVANALDVTDHNSSLYARAMCKAVDYLRAAGSLFEGDISLDQARPLMDIGVPERALVFVPKPAGR